MRKIYVLFVMLAAFVLVTACSSNKEEIIISGKPWTEQFILPYLLGYVIEDNTDYDIVYQDGLGEVAILTPAIEKGEIDLYVEYTGTGLMDVLELDTEPGESPESVYERVKEGYEATFNVTWLEPLGFENSYALAYRGDSDYDVETNSDLANLSKEEDLVFGAPHSFYERKGEGYDDLVRVYDFEFADVKSLDPNLMYDALKNGEVDVIPAFTTDSRIQLFDLATTEDDQHLFPVYDAVPIVRMETLEQFPKLREALSHLAGQIDEQAMLEMNAKVDIDHEKPEDVAKEFLMERGIISE